MLIAVIVLGVLGAGAAAFFFWIKPRWINEIDLGPGTTQLSKIAVNIGASDLLYRPDAASRLGIYLDELTGLGYSREIRIILTPDHGPFILEHWWPVIRANGFKVLVILGQEPSDSIDIADRSAAWAAQSLPKIRDDLLGVQVWNEFAYWAQPAVYIPYHRKMVATIRAAVPGIPIVCGDFGHADGNNGLNMWETIVRAGLRSLYEWNDYDIVSIHLTRIDKEGGLKNMVSRLKALHGPSQRYWVTEGDWGHLPWLNTQGLNTEKVFLYVWADTNGFALRPGGGILA